MIYLHLDRITKRFANCTALDDVSLSFARGEFVTVLGPSGCGKTTLLGILAGIEPPDSGRLLLEGRDITAVPPEKRNFGLVFQNYALFPNLTVRDNIAYGLHGRPKAEALARTRELVDMTELSGLENRYPAQLSGGQRQRVALARALAPDPAVLLLDEPLSALDAQVRVSLGQELLRLQRKTGVTAVMVTHDQQEALALADRVVLLNAGRVVQTGDPETLYARPAAPFAAEFVGHMNTVRLPSINGGRPTGIRFEDVRLARPSEQVLAQPNTWVGKVEHRALMGAFYRVEVLLNDFTTRLYADVPRAAQGGEAGDALVRGSLAAVTLPENRLRLWEDPERGNG